MSAAYAVTAAAVVAGYAVITAAAANEYDYNENPYPLRAVIVSK